MQRVRGRANVETSPRSLVEELPPPHQIRHHRAPGADGVVRVGHGLHEVLAAIVNLLLLQTLPPRRVAACLSPARPLVSDHEIHRCL